MADLTVPAAPAGGPDPAAPVHDLRGVLRIAPFRRLWVALSLSSLGDWLGLLATTALAANLGGNSYAAQNFAIAGVLLLRLTPALIFGPIAGVVADRLDRRWTMVVCDLGRFALFVSIPLVGTLWWLFVASFLIETLSLFWIPAKEASVPNLVPRHRLEAANQLSLLTTYGSAPLAALAFTLLSLVNGLLAVAFPPLRTNPVNLALYFDAATFLFSAATIYLLREIPRSRPVAPPAPAGEGPAVGPADGATPSVWRTLVDGWRFVGGTPMVRGLVVGMVGAFAAGGAVVGLAKTFVADLGGGDPAYGVLFGTVFLGLALGMFLGPRLLRDFSRRRLVGVAICAAGLTLALLSLMQEIVIAVLLTVVLGMFSGIAWVTGYTLLGLEVADDVRGRTFAFVQSLVRVTLVGILAVAPFVAGAIGRHTFALTSDVRLTYNGAAITLLLAGFLAAGVGVAAFRQMDDRPGVPVLADLWASLRGGVVAPAGGRARPGVFVVLEGGEGAGKSTQAERLADWLRAQGRTVVVTREPGGTPVGERLRALLLDPASRGLSARAEALLYAADRAQHVARVVRPALERGAVVVSDRYADSSVAYQGSGRALPPGDVERLSRWATDGLVPDLTVVLDVPPAVGLRRAGSEPDRLEAEPEDFHERVRRAFLALAGTAPERYLVVDATADPEAVAVQIRDRLAPLLPSVGPPREEAVATRPLPRADP